MTDIEISRNSNKLNIVEVANKLSLDKDDLVLYGDYKAKIKSRRFWFKRWKISFSYCN